MAAGEIARQDVPDVFDEVAAQYDRMVGMSPDYHRQLRSSAEVLVDAVRSRVRSTGRPGDGAGRRRHYLDLGCGSGASTAALVQATEARERDEEPPCIVAIDGSAGMLAAARHKSWPARVSFAQGRAESLDSAPELSAARADGGLDGVLAAYLVRNVPDRDALVESVHSELRPGGVLVVHEYSVRGRPLAALLWTLVCWGVIIPLGWLTSRHTDLYRYLWRSVLQMDSTSELEERLRRAGFERVRTVPVPGWQRGTVHSVVGHKSDAS